MPWSRGRFYLDMGGWHLEESRAEGKAGASLKGVLDLQN